jgi:meso-butanediol dehydrogenase/(S,S)-butanediol dehydrogenase/diacetyl reductase
MSQARKKVAKKVVRKAAPIYKRLKGKRVFITGAGSGIGRATALRFAAEGAHLAIADLRGAKEVASEITKTIAPKSGATVVAYDLDVTDASSVQKVVDKAAKSLGGLDIVCNIAGIGHFANSHEESPEWFDRIVSVNLNGTFYVSRYALPHLLKTHAVTGIDGVIVNTASTSGLMGAPWSAAYCASKGGVVNLTRALAYEYRGKGVRVNAIAPGGTNTNIVNSFMSLPPEADYKLMGKIMTPMDQAEPDEMANLFAFIASDEGRYMTGSIVVLDGGITC